MTKQLNPHVTPLVEDPSQPSYVRELLEAGRGAREGYDAVRGLEAHLSRVASGAAMPPWAQGLQPAAGSAAVAGAVSKGIVSWLASPWVIAAALVGATGAWVVFESTTQPADKESPRLEDRAGSTPVAAAARAVVAAESAARPQQPAAPAPEFVREISRSAKGTQAHATRRLPNVATALPARASAAPKQRVVGKTSAASGDVFATAQNVPAPAPARTVEAPKAAAVAEPAAAEPVAPSAPANPVAKQEVAEDPRLEREMAMLAMAERVLQTDPARTLRLTRQGEAEFGNSMFTQEREQLLLLSLIKLGKIEEARRLAKPYLGRFPNGPFSDRVRRALASGKVER